MTVLIELRPKVNDIQHRNISVPTINDGRCVHFNKAPKISAIAFRRALFHRKFMTGSTEAFINPNVMAHGNK